MQNGASEATNGNHFPNDHFLTPLSNKPRNAMCLAREAQYDLGIFSENAGGELPP